MKYRGYLGTVQYSEEDNLLYGRLAGIHDSVSYHGESLSELKCSFEEAVDHYVEACQLEGLSPDKPSIEELKKMAETDYKELVQNCVAI